MRVCAYCFWSVFLRRAQRAPDDLAGSGERQLLHELDDARVLVRGESRANVFLEVGFQRLSCREAFPEDDHRLHDFRADGVRLSHHRDQRDGWMVRKAGLDLAGADAVATAGDQIVVAADEAEVARLVADAEVAADQPVAAEL